MILLVTGGAGFIGSHFLRHMIHRYTDCHLINLDVLTYAGNLSNLKDLEHHPRYQFINGDIGNGELVGAIVSGSAPNQFGPVEVIVHFAAESHVDRSIGRPDLFIRTNVLGTQVLLDTARKFNVKKFIQVSTDEVYGELGETGRFTEETPLAPNSPYSASKAAADLLVRAYYKTYDLPAVITRCSNNYGPFHNPEKLIPLMITNALLNRELPIYGSGQNVRDWLHVKDHCAAIDLVVQQGKPGEIYNIGSNNERTNLETVKKILSLLNKSETLIRFVKDRQGHDRRYAIDASKIRRQLGWIPQYALDTGIKETVEWYVENRDWWMPLKE